MAKRLAEDSAISVAVVEAGSFYEFGSGNTSQVPAYNLAYATPLTNPPSLVDWNLMTTAQTVRSTGRSSYSFIYSVSARANAMAPSRH